MDIATIITSIGSAVGSFFLIKSSFDKGFDKIDARFEKIDVKLESMTTILHEHGERLSRIEGYIEGRDVSQKKKTGT